MATLKNVGTPPQWDFTTQSPEDLAPQAYIEYLLTLNMTMPQVTAQINAALTPFATQTYANSQMATLATEADAQEQITNYVPASTLGEADGPVQILAATTQVAPGVINEAGDQQWPNPYNSPTGYNTAVTASTPVELYPIAIAKPGYPYVLFCTGLVDTWVASDNGAYPMVYVRQGSTTGPIVAFGYGCGESYRPIPASQGQLAYAFGTSGGWETVPLVAINNATYVTTVTSGAFLQVQQAMSNVTVTASVYFAGAWSVNTATIYTWIALIKNGTNIAETSYAGITGGSSYQVSGTITVSWTGNVAAGDLFSIQITEATWFAADGWIQTLGYGVVYSASLTLTPSVVGNPINSAIANILPASFENQFPLNTATTLYVMLSSSDNVTQVGASPSFPALWAMPIPWTVPPAPPTTFDAVAAGSGGDVSTWTWTHTLGSTAEAILVFGEFGVAAQVVTVYGSGAKGVPIAYTYQSENVTTPPIAASIGGQDIPLLGWLLNYDEVGTEWYLLFVWGLIGPPTGVQTITLTDVAGTNTYGVASSVSYNSVQSFGNISSNNEASTSAVLQMETLPGEMAVMAFAGGGADGAFATFNQTSRFSFGGSGDIFPLLIGDAAAGGIVSQVPFTAMAPASTSGWGGLGITLSPAGLPTVIYDATGAGFTSNTVGSSVGGSWTHTAIAGAAVIVAMAVATNQAPGAQTQSASYGGTLMTFLGAVAANNGTSGYVALFGLSEAPAGPQTVAFSVVGTGPTFYASAANSISYLNVGSFGPPTTNYGASTTLTSGSAISTNFNQRIFQAFVTEYAATGVTYSGYSQVLQSTQSAFDSGSSLGVTLQLGDSPGGVLIFSETASATIGYGSIAIPLVFG